MWEPMNPAPPVTRMCGTMRPVRWLYHILPSGAAPSLDGPPGAVFSPPSLATEGFVHASYAPKVRESAALYFPPGSDLQVLRIDPRRLACRVVEAATPRGPMPHVHGAIPIDAIRAASSLDGFSEAVDAVRGAAFGFVGFAGMTLLDLVGVLDPVSRVRTMGFDPELTCEVSTLDGPYAQDGLRVSSAHRPPLANYDVVVVAGGLAARTLADDPENHAYFQAFPENRIAASVCTGALFWGAAGRLRGLRATTHRSALDRLAGFGAEADPGSRVVDAGQRITAGGVTAGLDLGLHLVRRLYGADVAARIANQMEYTPNA